MPRYQDAPIVFDKKTPKTVKQLEKMQEDYNKAFGRDLPASVALAMNAEKPPEEQ